MLNGGDCSEKVTGVKVFCKPEEEAFISRSFLVEVILVTEAFPFPLSGLETGSSELDAFLLPDTVTVGEEVGIFRSVLGLEEVDEDALSFDDQGALGTILPGAGLEDVFS